MKRTSIRSSYFVTYYHHIMRRKNGFKKGMIHDRGEVLRLLAVIWKTISEHYINSDAGVYIDNVGYLCHMLIPGQRFMVNKQTGIVGRVTTNGYKYKHTVLDFPNPKKYFHLVIHDRLKLKCKIGMYKGKRYRFMYNEVVAKRHIFKDFQIKIVYKEDDLVYRKNEKK